MNQKKVVPLVVTLEEFDACLSAKKPCVLDLPLAGSERLSLRDRVARVLNGLDSVSVFMGDTCESEIVGAGHFRDEFESGGSAFNILEHSLTNAECADLFIPPALRSPECNLLVGDEIWANPVSLVASPRYSHTVPHVDSGAFGNWMVLVEGRKLWMLVSPEDETECFVESTKTWSFDDENKTGIIHYGMLSANQLLFSPPGWVHGVITIEKSLGYGGQYLGLSDLSRCQTITQLLTERGVQDASYLTFYEKFQGAYSADVLSRA